MLIFMIMLQGFELIIGFEFITLGTGIEALLLTAPPDLAPGRATTKSAAFAS